MSRIDPFPHLHVRPARGWVNDPNGIGRWDGRWHVMYQWNPNGPEHRDIHWGHMSSTDMLSWQDDGVALRPRPGQIDAGGVWSGVAVAEADDVALVYTAVVDDARQARVAVARRGRDGSWIQPDRVAADHPGHEQWADVRDPFVLSVEGRRLGIVGAGRRVGLEAVTPTRGAALVYCADDLDEWELLGTLVSADELPAGMVGAGAIWECPQLVPMGGRWLFVVSWDARLSDADSGADAASRHRQGVTGYVGDLDTSGPVPRFVASTETTLDHCPDFYAPQIVVDNGRLLAWGWSWEGRGAGTNRRTADDIAASRWAGTLTFPREIDSQGRAIAVPAAELAGLVGDPIEVREDCGELRTAEPAWKCVTSGDVVLDLADEPTGRTRGVWAGRERDQVIIFVDGSIVEVFDHTGSTTLRAYPAFGEAWRLRSTGPLQATTLRVPPQDR